MEGERIGVFGGTFDPIHVGHIVAATTARHALGLDRVLLVVAGDPWQKRGQVVAAAADRLAMAHAAVDGIDGIEVCALEVEREGAAYTVDTLEMLARADRSLYLVVGADVAGLLGTWHRAERLPALATLVVIDRGTPAAEPAGGPVAEPAVDPAFTVVRVRMPRLDISSTDLRARAAAGEPLDGLVPAAAVRIVRERGLYTASR